MFKIYFKEFPESWVTVVSEEEAQEVVNASAGALDYMRVE